MITLIRTQSGMFEVGTETNRMAYQSLAMAFYAIGALQRVGIKKHGLLLSYALMRSLPVKHEPSEYNLKNWYAPGKTRVLHESTDQRYKARQLAVADAPGVMSADLFKHDEFETLYSGTHEDFKSVLADANLIYSLLGVTVLAGLLVALMFAGLDVVQHIIDVHPY